VTIPGPKRGDLEPDLIVDLVASPTTVDLSLVDSWKILGRLRGTTTLLINAATTPVVHATDKWKATVTHQWASPQTATAGLLLLEFEATWPGGQKQTFPTSGYIQLRISDDLG